MPLRQRRLLLRGVAAATAAAWLPRPVRAQPAAPSTRPPLLLAPRLKPGDTLALVNPSGAIHENAPYAYAAEVVAALGFRLREAPNLRARRGHFAGSDAQRAADLNAMFADPQVHGILAMSGGSGANRLLPLLDYESMRRTPKFLGGFSDVTALLAAVQARTGLVTFHCPMATSDWNEFSAASFRGTVIEGRAMEFSPQPEKTDSLVPRERFATLRGGQARGPLVGGNLAVLASLAGSSYWPSFDGAILFLEEVNEYIYRVDRTLSTLKNAGALQRLAGVVLGAFTNCTPGDGRFGTLTLDEVFDDYFGGLGVPVFRGAPIGHIRRKLTLPVGLPVEMDADASTLRLLQPAVR